MRRILMMLAVAGVAVAAACSGGNDDKAPETAGQQVLLRGEVGYPPRLADDPAPPPVLFLRGSLDVLAGPTVGIVGTRNATRTGCETAAALAAELARCGDAGPVPIGELARRRDIPVQFLEQLFAVLRRAGVLRSQRGVKGGYSFAREPSEITVLEIVELLDGKLGAGAESIFSEAAEAARAVLSNSTIADIVERENRDAGATMYYI